jgi:hypothetical protein
LVLIDVLGTLRIVLDELPVLVFEVVTNLLHMGTGTRYYNLTPRLPESSKAGAKGECQGNRSEQQNIAFTDPSRHDNCIPVEKSEHPTSPTIG